APFTFGRQAGIELVFINGRFNRQLSRFATFENVQVRPLAEVLRDDPKVLDERLGAQAYMQINPFVALNSASFADGAVVQIGKGVTLEAPIHLLFVTVPEDKPTITHPRVLIQAGAEAKASVVESYVGTT